MLSKVSMVCSQLSYTLCNPAMLLISGKIALVVGEMHVVLLFCLCNEVWLLWIGCCKSFPCCVLCFLLVSLFIKLVCEMLQIGMVTGRFPIQRPHSCPVLPPLLRGWIFALALPTQYFKYNLLKFSFKYIIH